MITGKMLRDAIVSGANAIINNKTTVDELNVFPVPDGDTGTNMSMTIGAARKDLMAMSDDCTVAQVASTAASCMLRGARGNSGVISSLLFRGFSKALKDKTTADAADLKAALRKGVDSAYKAVMKPTEGTILTVAREACEKAETMDETDVVVLWSAVVEAAKVSLANTPELLPVLKKAGVVDAGGRGIIYVFEGMLKVFKGEGMIETEEEKKPAAESFEAKGVYSKELEKTVENGYRTEFIVHKNEKASAEKLRALLEMIGENVAVVDDEGLIKCYVNTANPGKALAEAVKHGAMTNIKIENMNEQLAEISFKGESLAKQASEAGSDEQFKYMAVDNDVKFGFVAVAAGEGLENMFRDLGVDAVVTGGQTMNPSTEDILRAAQSVPAKTIFVLPNNKNIIMAAEQAAKLADRELIVLPTRTVPQGMTAMLNFDPEASAKENAVTMGMAAEGVQTGSITFAARNSDFEGHKIKRGDILAMENSKLSFVEKSVEKAAVKLAKQMMNRDSSFITIIYGEGITGEEAEAVAEEVRKRAPKTAEVTTLEGNQPVYYYLISVE
ncbi:MAG: DAK2 domain-containing protein [Oscillospiraceae bacterium]|nr:DAK2 domain-containing protein [Oscillospiraceae bacterium]